MRLRRVVNIVAIILIAVALSQLLALHSGGQPEEPWLLFRTVKAAQFNRVPFVSAIATLSRESGIPIEIDSEAKTASLTTIVNCQIFAGTLEQALHSICDSTTTQSLAYFTDRGRVHITTADRLPLTVRIYDVRDFYRKLVANYPADEDPRYPRPPSGGNISIFSGPPGPPPTPLPTRQRAIEKEQMETITRWIQDYITPDSWSDAGGVASIKGDSGFLVVAQTAEVHRLIEREFALLRQLDVVEWKYDLAEITREQLRRRHAE